LDNQTKEVMDEFFTLTNVDRYSDFRDHGDPVGYSSVDFWEWYASYSIDSSIRGGLAEYLVMKSLRVDQRRSYWGKYDLSFMGKGIEVKSASRFCCKHPEREGFEITENKRIVFDIKKRHHHVNGSNWTNRERCSEIYVFCLITKIPVTEIANWEFYPVLSADIESAFGDHQTVSLSRIRKLSNPVTYADLRNEVIKKLYGGADMPEQDAREEKERTEQVNELQRLLACYQLASRDDKNVVWAALNKYMPYVD
jgi:hypothetical protein